MIRWLTLILLTGCTGLGPVAVSGVDGQPREYVYFSMNPLCLIICTTTVTTSGVDNDTIGAGDVSTGASTNTQSTTTGAIGK